MSTNEMRCSNCGTTNPPGRDKCVQCGEPLTASADMALRTQMDAQSDEAVMGSRNEVTVMGTGLPTTMPGDNEPHDPTMPVIPPRPA